MKAWKYKAETGKNWAVSFVTWVGVYIRSYEKKVKSSRLAYNRRETKGKWELGKDLDRGWCHCHTSVKLSWS